MANYDLIFHHLGRVSRQYFQLLSPEQLQWPPGDVVKDSKVQAWIYDNMFSEKSGRHPPPDRYRLRVLKHLVLIIEGAVVDNEEDEISDDLMNVLSTLLSSKLPSEVESAQEQTFVTYDFVDEDHTTHPITVLESRGIISSSGTTGLRTWEAALHLASYLRTTAGQAFVKNKNILELGAGTGLVSLLCAKHLGARHVMATDGSEVIVDLIGSNIFANGLDESRVMEAAALKWGFPLGDASIEEDYGNGTLDLVVGADITYDKTIIFSLLYTLRQLFNLQPGLQALIAATVRNEETLDAFQKACRRNRLQYDDIVHEVLPVEDQWGPFYSNAIPIRIIHIRAVPEGTTNRDILDITITA